MDELPDELLLQIFLYALPPFPGPRNLTAAQASANLAGVLRWMCVCRRWCRVVRDAALWRQLVVGDAAGLAAARTRLSWLREVTWEALRIVDSCAYGITDLLKQANDISSLELETNLEWVVFSIAQHCRRLRRLRLPPAHTRTTADAVFHIVGTWLPELQALHFAGAPGRGAVAWFLRNHPRLTELSVDVGCPASLAALAQHGDRLTRLQIGRSVHRLADSEAAALVQQCTSLRELLMPAGLSGFSWKEVGCVGLRHLSCIQLDVAAAEALTTACPQLREIHVDICEDDVMEALSGAPNLVTLVVRATAGSPKVKRLRDGSVGALLNGCGRLAHLELADAAGLTDHFVTTVTSNQSRYEGTYRTVILHGARNVSLSARRAARDRRPKWAWTFV